MTELELYKFVQGKEIDWRGDKLILWIDSDSLAEFAEMLGDNYLSEGDVQVTLLQEGLIAIELNDICECFEIEPTKLKGGSQVKQPFEYNSILYQEVI